MDAEYERTDKPAAGLLSMMARNESDEDPSEDAIQDAEPAQKPRRGGGRWGKLVLMQHLCHKGNMADCMRCLEAVVPGT